MVHKACCSDVQHGFDGERVSEQGHRLTMLAGSKFARLSTEKPEESSDAERYWLELDDIHELIRKLDEEDAG